MVAFAMLAESLIQDQLFESARREVLTHTTYLAGELPLNPTSNEIREFESRLRQVVSKSDATAIALYRNTFGGDQMQRIAVQSDSDSTLNYFPETIRRPDALLSSQIGNSQSGPETHLITALTTERGRPIGAIRLATSLGHAGTLISLINILITVIGLGFLAATFVFAGYFSKTIRKPLETIAASITPPPPATPNSSLYQETSELAGLADRLGEIVSGFNHAEDQQADLASLQTRLRERSRLLQDAYLDMDSMDRAKDAFLSNISHEMRTPLTSILAAEEILSNFGDEDPLTRKEFLDIIHQESTRLLGLIGKLLDLAKLEAKALQLHHEEVDMNQVVSELVANTLSQHKQGDLDIQIEAPATTISCECDKERIARIIHSMLECAIHHNPADASIALRIDHDDQSVSITIADQGEHTSTRFTDMFDGMKTGLDDAIDTRPFIGYPIAQKLAVMHGGSLQPAASENGTTVTLTLPRLQTAKSTAGNPSSA